MLRSMIAGLVIAVVLTFGSALAATPGTAYRLKAVIEPATGSLAVTGDITVPANGPKLKFILHKTFEITQLTVDGKNADFAYEAAGPIPVARFVAVKLPVEATGKPIRLFIAYHGVLEKVPEWGAAPEQKFGMDDQINDKLVYLAVYSFWYPVMGPYGEQFRSDLEVSLPKGWTVVSGGERRDLGTMNGRSVTRWSVEQNLDIALTASPDYGRLTAAGVEVDYVAMDDALVAAEAKNLSAVMALFEAKLGVAEVPGGVVRHVYAPLAHGQGRAGIARPGLIITSEGRVREAMAADPHYSLFQDVAHEIAHFWWHFGSGQGDWVNETFAEYFSALAVRDLVSNEAFEAALARYRQGVAGLPADAPSLATVSRDGNVAWTVRYQKGALMLDDFRQRMGDAGFLAAARAFFQTYKNGAVGTAEFRAFWSERLGDSARLDLWLQSKGGLPALP